jgi:nitrogen fixation protein FixH
MSRVNLQLMKFHLAMMGRENSMDQRTSILLTTVAFGLCLTTSMWFLSIEANAATGQRQLSGVYTIQQMSNDRYVDAHENSKNDYALVTRPAQNNDTQRWILTPLGDNVYTIQQKRNRRYVDAHENSKNNYRLVTRPAQENDTQRWILTLQGDNVYTIQQQSSGRYVDAYENSDNDYRLITRQRQNNYTQQWLFQRL